MDLLHDAQYRCESLPGEIPFENYIKITDSHPEPADAVGIIRQRFGF